MDEAPDRTILAEIAEELILLLFGQLRDIPTAGTAKQNNDGALGNAVGLAVWRGYRQRYADAVLRARKLSPDLDLDPVIEEHSGLTPYELWLRREQREQDMRGDSGGDDA